MKEDRIQVLIDLRACFRNTVDCLVEAKKCSEQSDSLQKTTREIALNIGDLVCVISVLDDEIRKGEG